MNITEHFPILIIIIPLISAIIIPLAGRINIHFCWWIATTGIFFSFIISLFILNTVIKQGSISYWLGGWQPPWGIEYAIDYLSAFMLVIVSFIGIIISIYSKQSTAREIEKNRIPFFYSVLALLLTGLMGIVASGDIFNIYIFLEISSLSGYALIATGRKRESLLSSYNYLILGTIGAIFILLAIGYLYAVTGTLNINDMRERLPPMYNSKVVLTAFAFLTVGLSLKLALFPLHIWLPNAYTYAPSVISAVMAAISTKVIAYFTLRVIFTVFTINFAIKVVPITKILLFLSCLAMIAGSVLALSQTNIKRMLAYSSVGQIGYIVLGLAIMNTNALTGTMLHLLNHALMKGALFLAAGSLLYKTGIETILELKGIGQKMPLTAAAFTIGGLSMIGIPSTVGFVSKWYIAIGAIKAGMWFLVPVILLSSLLSAVYFWRIIEVMYLHKLEITNDKPVDEVPAVMLIPVLVLAGLCIFLGIAAFIPVPVAEKAANILLEII